MYSRKLDVILINKKKKSYSGICFASRHWVKEVEKLKKYLGLGKELKKLENVKVSVESIVVEELETDPNSKEKRFDGLVRRWRVEIICATACLKPVMLLWRSMEIWGELLSIRSQWKKLSFITDLKTAWKKV